MTVLRAGLIAPLFLAIAGCSSVQRNTPIQVWDDMKHCHFRLVAASERAGVASGGERSLGEIDRQ